MIDQVSESIDVTELCWTEASFRRTILVAGPIRAGRRARRSLGLETPALPRILNKPIRCSAARNRLVKRPSRADHDGTQAHDRPSAPQFVDLRGGEKAKNSSSRLGRCGWNYCREHHVAEAAEPSPHAMLEAEERCRTVRPNREKTRRARLR
jgi:hypothetical protein